MATPINNAAKVIRTLKNQVDEYHLLYAQTLAERDALQARLKLAEGLAEALEAEKRVVDAYWAYALCDLPFFTVGGRETESVLLRYEALAEKKKEQALAAWRAES